MSLLTIDLDVSRFHARLASAVDHAGAKLGGNSVSARDRYIYSTGTRHFAADTPILAWLEDEGFAYDSVTDKDLDNKGAALLAPYRAGLTARIPSVAPSGRGTRCGLCGRPPCGHAIAAAKLARSPDPDNPRVIRTICDPPDAFGRSRNTGGCSTWCTPCSTIGRS